MLVYDSEAVVSIGKVRIRLQRLFVIADSTVIVALLRVRPPALVVSLCITGIDPQGLIKVFDGVVVVALCLYAYATPRASYALARLALRLTAWS